MDLKTIVKKFENFRFKYDMQSVISDSLQLWAIRVSNVLDIWQEPERKRIYSEISQRYKPEELVIINDIFMDVAALLQTIATEKAFDDYLGRLYMESGTASKQAGQFFTPYNVSRLLGSISATNDVINKSIITVNEPACGSGGTILAFLEALQEKGVNYTERVLVVAQDIDRRCVAMTYLQLSFAGVPAVVQLGNTITQKFTENWFTPAFMLQYPKFKNIFQNLGGNKNGN